jgi:hypothetical protein
VKGSDGYTPKGKYVCSIRIAHQIALQGTIDVALFLISALGLLYVHDLSVRETNAELRRLRALLSMCAWCRKIKNDGEWVGLEHYMAQRQDIALTHGMCPTCYEAQTRGE